MDKHKLFKKFITLSLCILINLAGKYISHRFSLPIILDSVGVFLACYFAGPFWGVLSAIPAIFVVDIYDSYVYMYVLISILIMLPIAILFKKGYIKGLITMINAGFLSGMIAIILVPVACLITGEFDPHNVWGEGLYDMMIFYGYGKYISISAATAFVELIDKQICAIIAYLIIILHTGRRYSRPSWERVINTIVSLCVAFAVFFGFFADAKPVMAAEDDLYFAASIFDGNSGMLSTEGNCIIQTEDGYLWIGSHAGLISYDGNKFTRKDIPGVNSVNCLAIDDAGDLWIGTNNSGVVHYINDANRVAYTTNEGLPNDSVRALCVDKKGGVYVATSDGLCYIKSDGTISKSFIDSTYITCMAEYNGAIICVNSFGNIFAYRNGRRIDYYQEEENPVFYNAVAVTSDGVYAGSTQKGLIKIKVTERYIQIGENIEVPMTNITNIMEDSRGFLWVCADDGCGYLYKGRFYNETVSGFASAFSGIQEDFQGNIWISSSKNGLLRLATSQFVDIFKKINVQHASANAVIRYNDQTYIGTDNGLIILDSENESRIYNTLSNMLGDANIQCILDSGDGKLWIGTFSDTIGLICYDVETEEMFSFNSENGLRSGRIKCIAQGADDTVIVGTQGGLAYIRDGQIVKTIIGREGLENAQVQSILAKDNGDVYVCTDGAGLFVIRDYEVIRHYTADNGLGSDVVYSAASYGAGAFVVTSNSIDLVTSNTVRRINFPCENNYQILIDKQTAYIICSAGLYMVDTKELISEEDPKYRLYSFSSRLGASPVIDGKNFIDKNGMLYLCCNNKVLEYRPWNATKTGVDCKYDIGYIKTNNSNIYPDKNSDEFIVPAEVRQITIFPSIRNYALKRPIVRFFVKEFDENPDYIDFDDVEPIIISNISNGQYHVVIEIYDGENSSFVSSKSYTITKQARIWENSWYKIYLLFVIFEVTIYLLYLLLRLRNNFRRKNELEKQQEYLERKVDEQTASLLTEREHTKKLFNETIMALSNSVDAKDHYTSGHSKRVADYSVMIAARMGKNRTELESVYRAGLLHDVGKIRVPSAVINKTGKLTDEEYEIIKMHPVTGYHVLKNISYDKNIMEAARFHHERYDGLGYPNGLAGTNIPEIARIIGVADAYDAMTSNRSYRPAMKQADVRAEIEKGIGKQFDPDIANIMLQIIDGDVEYEYHEKNMAQVKNILLIDEDEESYAAIVDILHDEPKYVIKQAKTYSDALDILEHEKEDMIIIDTSVVDANAFEVAEQLIKKYKDIPVVFTMDNRDTQVIRKIMDSGVQDYMTKPIAKEILRENVHNLINPY